MHSPVCEKCRAGNADLSEKGGRCFKFQHSVVGNDMRGLMCAA